jgi:hypothetical protein
MGRLVRWHSQEKFALVRSPPGSRWGAGVVLSAVAVAVPWVKSQQLKWATGAGDPGQDEGFGIATDPRGNSYVTGRFGGAATFGAGGANETELEAVSALDVFVAKYAPDGTLLWATSAGGPGRDIGIGIATDPGGNSYVTGFFDGTATFGAGEDNETVLEAVSALDVFVAKYAPDGTLLWARGAGGSGQDEGFGIATDPRGNSYVTGRFGGTATFGAGEANEAVLEAVAGEDPFVAKYAPDGTLLWATSARTAGIDTSGTSINTGIGIATDPQGNSYVTGQFFGTATFGAGEDNETVLEAVSALDVFVAKYAPDGALLWARGAGGAAVDEALGVAIDPHDNSYVTGDFYGTATFGAGEANETVLEAAGPCDDVFVAKYAPDGTLLWATSAGGGGCDGGASIATDPRGNSYVTGRLGGTATFGVGEANETVLEGSGIFVAKYGSLP